MCEDWMTECPLCSIFLNLAVWFSLAIIFWCTIDQNQYNGVVSPRDLVALPVVVFILLYAFYLTECYFASTRKYLASILKGENIYEYLERIQKEPPVLSFRATCWHNETKQRNARFTDRGGKTHTRLESFTEKVVTLTDEERFNFQRWEDISVIPGDFPSFTLVKVNFTKAYELKNDPTKILFTNLSCGFHARNRHRDKRVDFEEVLSINGFKDHVIAYVNEGVREKWLCMLGYWLFSVLLLTWVYRWMFNTRITVRQVAIVKRIEVVYGTPVPAKNLIT
ncbi:predicted protein [Nematostella vectensis]|uniref:Uncharacterized protein n=1 Tax=Nematostella vectensis TaxID=45351 RepID=A7RMN0_NEMVE|nr:transmembrane protein 151 homolog [Nematostella vectensis]EDO47296.1 predicted protein [Nematostella vectensis]|eukprot:XP_001639359.1 predicted protein [Nematostella vectensis]